MPQLQLPSGELNSSPEGAWDGLISLPKAKPTHLDSALSPELTGRLIKEMRALPGISPTVRCRLSVADATDSLSLELRLTVEEDAKFGIRLHTTKDSQHLRFALDVSRDGRARLDLTVRYAGLPTEDALTHARFLSALYGRSGVLYLTSLEPEEFTVELVKLPLALRKEGEKEVGDLIRLLEAVQEVGKATGVEFSYPSEMSEEDLQDLNYVLKVVRSGWVTQSVTDFTTPLNAEGVRNILDLVAEEGPVARAFAMTSEYEERKLFGSGIGLGPSMRYISAARLESSPSEMENWLAEGDKGGSFEVRWVPEDGAQVHVFYSEWPKPSLEVVRRNIRAFEDEYGLDSDEFLRAWNAGEADARGIEEGEIWLSFLAARESLKESD